MTESQPNTMLRQHIANLQSMMSETLDPDKKLEIAGRISEAISYMDRPLPSVPTVAEMGNLLQQFFDKQAEVRKEMAEEQKRFFDKTAGAAFLIRNACAAAAAERAKVIVEAKSPTELTELLRSEMRLQLCVCSSLRVMSAELRGLEVAGTPEADAQRAKQVMAEKTAPQTKQPAPIQREFQPRVIPSKESWVAAREEMTELEQELGHRVRAESEKAASLAPAEEKIKAWRN